MEQEKKMHFETSAKTTCIRFGIYLLSKFLGSKHICFHAEMRVQCGNKQGYELPPFMFFINRPPPLFEWLYHITSHDIKSSTTPNPLLPVHFSPILSLSLSGLSSFPLHCYLPLEPTYASRIAIAQFNRVKNERKKWTCEIHQLKIYMQKYTPYSLFYKMINYDWAIYSKWMCVMYVYKYVE